MSQVDVVLLSVQSPHVERILAGTKTVELRRRPMNLRPGTVVLLYAAGVRRALVGSFVSGGSVDSGTPASLWRRHCDASGLSRAEYDRYFIGATVGYAVRATAVRSLREPIPLQELRRRWPRFSTPQTHRRVESHELGCILNGERSLLIPPSSEA